MMWLLISLALVFIFASTKVPRSTLIYYGQLLAFGLVTQLGFMLPFLYFPFRPFDYRNAK